VRIVHLTAGTGAFHCGACSRDNALVAGLEDLGHDATLLPLYLPIVTDDRDLCAGEPILLGGINMVLQQRSRFFRRTPGFVDRIFDARPLLRLAARRAAATSPESLGAMTVSTLAGEAGNQRKEIRRLAERIAAGGPPDVLCLSNVLLSGLLGPIRELLGPVKAVCALQGEDAFLDGLPEPHRSAAFDLVRERCREIDAFLPVSGTHGATMTARLCLPPDRVHVVHPGIRVDDHLPAETAPSPPVIGFLARMSPAKGLATLVEAFLDLRRKNRIPGVRLRVAGSRTPADRAFVRGLEARIEAEGATAAVDWLPNVTRAEKLEFLRGLSVLSVPATHGEDFGLYVLEALASGVPVVEPAHGAFPELIRETGGGILCAPDDAADLARALGDLLLDPARARSLGAKGREAVLSRFTIPRMARRVLEVLEEVRKA
jgi:glycosyltransferase involved in cell wall biosynthesis